MDKLRLKGEFERDAEWRGALSRAEPPAAVPREHDALILATARETSAVIRKRAARRASWRMPLYLAASFVLGMAVLPVFDVMHSTTEPTISGLVVPLGPQVRGAPDSGTAPVEEVPADVWYRHIQELIYTGDSQLAARHLQRFVELHPDYVHQR